MPQIDGEKEEIDKSITNVQSVMNTTLHYACQYIKKCHLLAKFIVEEKDTVISEIEAKNSEALKNFLSKYLTIQTSVKRIYMI